MAEPDVPQRKPATVMVDDLESALRYPTGTLDEGDFDDIFEDYGGIGRRQEGGDAV